MINIEVDLEPYICISFKKAVLKCAVSQQKVTLTGSD